jgi:hypothetical protein
MTKPSVPWNNPRLEVEELYQNQSLLVRICRRLKYQPYYFIKAILHFPMNVYYYLTDEDYIDPLFSFQITSSYWEVKAKWVYIKDIFEEDDYE